MNYICGHMHIVHSSRLKGMIADLVEASVPFYVEPYPDDYWKIAVKRESFKVLNAITLKHAKVF